MDIVTTLLIAALVALNVPPSLPLHISDVVTNAHAHTFTRTHLRTKKPSACTRWCSWTNPVLAWTPLHAAKCGTSSAQPVTPAVSCWLPTGTHAWGTGRAGVGAYSHLCLCASVQSWMCVGLWGFGCNCGRRLLLYELVSVPMSMRN